MKIPTKTAVGIFVLVEIVTIFAIIFYIYRQRGTEKNVLNRVIFSPLSKKDFVRKPSTKLRYYYELVPNSRIVFEPSWLSYKAVFTINADTLNERFDYQQEKPPGVYRILTLGDSFTFGLGVSTNDNWPEQLEDLLNREKPCPLVKKFEVINLGVPGYGVEYISHRYETRGVKYNPDLLVWLESGADFDRVNELLEEYGDKYEPMTAQVRMSLWLQGGETPAWGLGVKELYNDYTYKQLSDMVAKSWQEFFALRGNVPVLVATFSNVPDDKIEQLKLWTNNQKNVTLLDSLPNITLAKYKLPDEHPNVVGHQMIAQNIYDYLKNNSIIPCTP